MDEAKVSNVCRLLHEALYDDLELQRLVVQVERDRVVLTIHPKRGRQQSKVVVGEDPTQNVLDKRRWRPF